MVAVDLSDAAEICCSCSYMVGDRRNDYLAKMGCREGGCLARVDNHEGGCLTYVVAAAKAVALA